MTDITYFTGAGHRRAPDVTDALLSATAPAISRAQAEIERERPGADEGVECRLSPDILCGHRVALYDHVAGHRSGRVVAVTHRHQRGQIDTTALQVRL